MQQPILVTSVPNACDIAGQLGEKRSVYYCVDDFSQWSGYDHDLVREMNDALLKKADIILATSDYLLDQIRQSGKPVSLLTHGVDIDHFSLIPEREHPVLAAIKSPRIGFFGVVDDRIDQALIYTVARARPGVTFVFAGPVLDMPQQLRDLPNVRFIGTIAYAHMPFLVAGLSALILPYKIDDSTAAIAPLKLKEYIATGRPIIATPMAEVVPFKEHVVCHADSDGWIKAVDAALQKPMDKGQQRIPEWLKTQSWDHKAQQMLTLMTRD
jgi:glycosyltransferase involved in cell wall biosynthesis